MARWLVVGGGLAGTLAAEALWFAGEVVVQRDAGRPAASRVAAGMFNPVSFRRVVEVWDAAEHRAEAERVYRRFEGLLGGTYWHDVPVVRVFPSSDYARLWEQRIREGHGVSKWIELVEPEAGVGAPFGVGRVDGAGWVDVPALLDAWADWAKSEPERLTWQEGAWSWEDGLPAGFDGVVDARGVGAVGDLARWGVPINPNHGEVLTLKPGAWNGAYTLNANKWLLPQPGGGARLGATYAWNIPDERILPASRAALLAAFSGVLAVPVGEADVADHRAGLRPASPDRRPLVGRLSDRHPWYSVINGLGTRGVLVGPAAAQALARELLGSGGARELTNPRRFRSFNEI